MVAGHGDVEGEHVVFPRALVVLDPGSPRILVHSAESRTCAQIMVVPAGHLAGLAARAAPLVEREAELMMRVARGTRARYDRHLRARHRATSPRPAASRRAASARSASVKGRRRTKHELWGLPCDHAVGSSEETVLAQPPQSRRSPHHVRIVPRALRQRYTPGMMRGCHPHSAITRAPRSFSTTTKPPETS